MSVDRGRSVPPRLEGELPERSGLLDADSRQRAALAWPSWWDNVLRERVGFALGSRPESTDQRRLRRELAERGGLLGLRSSRPQQRRGHPERGVRVPAPSLSAELSGVEPGDATGMDVARSHPGSRESLPQASRRQRTSPAIESLGDRAGRSESTKPIQQARPDGWRLQRCPRRDRVAVGSGASRVPNERSATLPGPSWWG